MTDVNDDGPDEKPKVGYKRPPQHRQFQKGLSGNPKGRPKGAPNLRTVFKKVIELPVTVSKKGKPKTVLTLEGLLLLYRDKALKGDPRAMDRFLTLSQTLDDADSSRANAGDSVSNAEDEALLGFYAELIIERNKQPSTGGAYLADRKRDADSNDQDDDPDKGGERP